MDGFIQKKNDLEDTFFLLGGNTWGWGTWKRAWDKFNPNTSYLMSQIEKKKLIKKFNLNNSYDYFSMLKKRHKGLNDSHTIIWKASTFLNQMYSLYPSISLVKNIGFDGSGNHNKVPDTTHVHNFLQEKKIFIKRIKIEENLKAVKFLKKFYLVEKFKKFLKKVLKLFIKNNRN